MSTAIWPFNAVSTIMPWSWNCNIAILRLSSLSSTIKIFLPCNENICSPLFACSGSSFPNACRRTFCNSDKKNGFKINPVTPASLASDSMSAQSYAVIMIMDASSPTTLRMRRAVSIPFISGISQSTINTLKWPPPRRDSSARVTASLPEPQHSLHIPTFRSMSAML